MRQSWESARLIRDKLGRIDAAEQRPAHFPSALPLRNLGRWSEHDTRHVRGSRSSLGPHPRVFEKVDHQNPGVLSNRRRSFCARRDARRKSYPYHISPVESMKSLPPKRRRVPGAQSRAGSLHSLVSLVSQTSGSPIGRRTCRGQTRETHR